MNHAICLILNCVSGSLYKECLQMGQQKEKLREIVAEIVLLCASIYYTIFTGAVLLCHNLVQVALLGWCVQGC